MLGLQYFQERYYQDAIATFEQGLSFRSQQSRSAFFT